MLWKKTDWFWKNGFIAISIMLLSSVLGCSNVPQAETQITKNESEMQAPIYSDWQEDQEEIEKIIKICCDFYEKAAKERGNLSAQGTCTKQELADLEVIRSIVKKLGENGYIAVDSENQINMTEAEQVTQFCKLVADKEKAELSIIVISHSGGFTKYDFKTEDGNVDIIQGYYHYESGQLKNMSTGRYRADTWEYTKDGYLMFSGGWFSEEQYVLTLSGAEEHVALRVEPLHEKCRELNRQYLLQVGYERNNMFLVDWSEDDFGGLDFYDLYDAFYRIINNQYAPYADDGLEAGDIYRIPQAEFESIIMEYINIDSETLQSKTRYLTEDAAYRYRPRGFYEVEYPDVPYPEVVDYIENNDGTITLMVNAVYPNGDTSKLYVHEVKIRILDDGHFQYVSNKVVTPADDNGLWWHSNRLTEEEWEEIYGGFE